MASPPERILLVDDDPGLLRLLSIRLRAESYEVEAVESAHKALATLNNFNPDLVRPPMAGRSHLPGNPNPSRHRNPTTMVG